MLYCIVGPWTVQAIDILVGNEGYSNLVFYIIYVAGFSLVPAGVLPLAFGKDYDTVKRL